MQAYIASPQNQEPIIEEYEEISREERLGETVMLSLRLCEGLDTQAFAQQFRRDFDSLFGTKLAPFEQEGLVMRRGDRVYLTPRGMLLSNTVLAELLEKTGGIVQGMGVIDNRDNTKKPENKGFSTVTLKLPPTLVSDPHRHIRIDDPL